MSYCRLSFFPCLSFCWIRIQPSIINTTRIQQKRIRIRQKTRFTNIKTEYVFIFCELLANYFRNFYYKNGNSICDSLIMLTMVLISAGSTVKSRKFEGKHVFFEKNISNLKIAVDANKCLKQIK